MRYKPLVQHLVMHTDQLVLEILYYSAEICIFPVGWDTEAGLVWGGSEMWERGVGRASVSLKFRFHR